jgi:hypothetical protein
MRPIPRSSIQVIIADNSSFDQTSNLDRPQAINRVAAVIIFQPTSATDLYANHTPRPNRDDCFFCIARVNTDAEAG